MIVFKLNKYSNDKLKNVINNDNLNHFKYIGESRIDKFMMYEDLSNNRKNKLKLILNEHPEPSIDDKMLLEVLKKRTYMVITILKDYIYPYV